MAAGLGFKDFTTGEVLTAADVDGYLMQGIWVFASTAARDAAVTAPAEGNFAFTKDTNSLWYYDGAAWVASGATGDIEGVTAGIGISGGGTSGTVTVTNSMATAIDAKGDLIGGTGADTFARLAVGANDTVLTADSTTATGLKWAAPASGGGMTLINSGGTALSGTSTQISSIPDTYNDLIVYIVDFNHSTNPSPCRVTFNNDTTAANYQQFVNRGTGSTDGSYVDNATSGMDVTGYAAVAGDNNNFATVYVANYANTVSRKVANSMAGFQANTSPASRAVTNNTTAYNATTLKITSLEIRCPDATGWAGGTVYVYGVK